MDFSHSLDKGEYYFYNIYTGDSLHIPDKFFDITKCKKYADINLEKMKEIVVYYSDLYWDSIFKRNKRDKDGLVPLEEFKLKIQFIQNYADECFVGFEIFLLNLNDIADLHHEDEKLLKNLIDNYKEKLCQIKVCCTEILEDVALFKNFREVEDLTWEENNGSNYKSDVKIGKNSTEEDLGVSYEWLQRFK